MALEVSIRKQLRHFVLQADFQLENGCMGLMGSSGSGKSMTLKCIAGLEQLDSGRIVLDGRVLYDSERGINLTPQERNVGYLFQSYALFPNMDATDNIFCGLRAKGMTKKEAQPIIDSMVERFQLQGLEHSYPRQLSGGQRQRVAIARLMAMEPQVILLDEPFSALDEDLKLDLQGQLLELLQSYAGTSILVSHDRQEVKRLSDEQYSIKDGLMKKEDK